ncbi:hypothetical protein V9K67_26650 [Paraflavisolibacter sp. H34]|uniref:hypothetical protein n=1 Tax=Huijunlia imazamoxiresistens TaxID=3127457 RepID=UPI003019727B
MNNQSLNFQADLFASYSTLFVKFVALIILIYALVIVVNFFRDKYINKTETAHREDILGLLSLLNKLLFFSGFGFVVANIFQVVLNEITRDSGPQMSFHGKWDYLTFGIILIFMGSGLKYGKKVILKERTA